MTTATIVRISNLPSLSTISDATIFPVVDGGITQKTLGLTIKDYIGTVQGPSGPQGDPGPSGPAGDQGPSGPGSDISVTDGTTTVISPSTLQFSGATVSDNNGNAVVVGTVLKRSVSLTASQLADLHNTPVELVPPPGMGKVIFPVSMGAIGATSAPLPRSQYPVIFSNWSSNPQSSVAADSYCRGLWPDGSSTADVAGLEPTSAENNSLVLMSISELPIPGAIVTSTLNNGGTGWAVNDTFKVGDASFIVTSVDSTSTGVVTGYNLTNAGTTSTLGTNIGANSKTIQSIGGPEAIAISPDGTKAYVSNYDASTVTPINLITGEPGTPISVGANPFSGIVFTPDGSKAYVTCYGGGVVPIDVATNTPETEITANLNGPEGIAITPDGTKVYVCNENDASITVIDVATNTPGTPIPIGNFPWSIAITPDGSKAYVTCRNDNTVVPVDLSTDTPGTPISISGNVWSVAIAPNGTKAYVSNSSGDNIQTIDVSTDTTGTVIAVGASPKGLVITPDSNKAYVCCEGSGTVVPVNLVSETAGTPIPINGIEHSAQGIAITPNGTKVYVTSYAENNVYMINTASDLFPGGLSIDITSLDYSVNTMTLKVTVLYSIVDV